MFSNYCYLYKLNCQFYHYCSALASRSTTPDAHEEDLVRNMKQVQNIKYAMDCERDDIFDTIAFANDHAGFIQCLDLSKGLNVVLAHSGMINHVNKLYDNLTVLTNDNPICFFYDTTFQMGNFFLSLLSYNHPCFYQNKTVLMAVYIHCYTEEVDHRRFFTEMKFCVPNLDSPKTVIVTDREKSIINAIKNHLSSVHHVFCWNHMKQVIQPFIF